MRVCETMFSFEGKRRGNSGRWTLSKGRRQWCRKGKPRFGNPCLGCFPPCPTLHRRVHIDLHVAKLGEIYHMARCSPSAPDWPPERLFTRGINPGKIQMFPGVVGGFPRPRKTRRKRPKRIPCHVYFAIFHFKLPLGNDIKNFFQTDRGNQRQKGKIKPSVMKHGGLLGETHGHR